MFFPLKFVAANIFMAGVTAGAVGGATAVYVLSDQHRGTVRINRLARRGAEY